MERNAVRIFWAADSTVQTNDITTYPQTGIGQVFPLYVREGGWSVTMPKTAGVPKALWMRADLP